MISYIECVIYVHMYDLITRIILILSFKGNKFVYSYHSGWGYRIEPRSQVSISPLQKYCKASAKVVECVNCEKRLHAYCAKLGDDELSKLESEMDLGIVSNCKADCGLCSGAVLNSHKAVQCNKWRLVSQWMLVHRRNPVWNCAKFKLYLDFPEMRHSTLFPILSLTTS